MILINNPPDTQINPPPLPCGRAAFLLLGAYTLTIQILLVRESFLLFSGNELSLAIQLFLWLALTSLGGATGALLTQSSAPWLLSALPLAGLGAVAAIRLFPLILPVAAGSEIPLGWSVLTLALAQFPFNMIAGMFFSPGCRYFGQKNDAREIGRFYTFEALGGAASGIIVTFFFLGRIPGMDLAAILSAFVALATFMILRKIPHASRFPALAIALIIAASLTLFRPSRLVDDLWWNKAEPGSSHLFTRETHYQRLDWVLRYGQHTLYSNGRPLFTWEDVQESLSGARLADLYLSLFPDPRAVLIIGSGEPGLPLRMLEYSNLRISYVTLDPWLADAIGKINARGADLFAPANTRKNWKMLPGDARQYLLETGDRFDLILLELPAPGSAAENRIFTAEAFHAARRILKPSGLLILNLPSSDHYLGEETLFTIASIRRALLHAFQGRVQMLSGEVMILVGGRDKPFSLPELTRRFIESDVAPHLDGADKNKDPKRRAEIFEALYSPFCDQVRAQQQLEELQNAPVAMNTDAKPVAYYLNQRKWLAQIGLSPATVNHIFRRLEKGIKGLISYGWICFLFAALFVGGLIWLTRKPAFFSARSRVRRGFLAFAMLVSGGSGILVELLIIFAWQNRFGQIYQTIGALYATYMLGLVIGSRAATSHIPSTYRSIIKNIFLLRFLIILSFIVMVFLDSLPHPAILFILLFIYAGLLGVGVPWMNVLYFRDEGGRCAAGILYSMDCLGAALGALAGGAVLLPLLGIHALVLLLAALQSLIVIGLVFY